MNKTLVEQAMNKMILILGIKLCSIFINKTSDKITKRTARQNYINNMKYLLDALARSLIIATCMVNKANEISLELAV